MKENQLGRETFKKVVIFGKNIMAFAATTLKSSNNFNIPYEEEA